jgi:hypothetical protein
MFSSLPKFTKLKFRWSDAKFKLLTTFYTLLQILEYVIEKHCLDKMKINCQKSDLTWWFHSTWKMKIVNLSRGWTNTKTIRKEICYIIRLPMFMLKSLESQTCMMCKSYETIPLVEHLFLKIGPKSLRRDY